MATPDRAAGLFVKRAAWIAGLLLFWLALFLIPFLALLLAAQL